MSSIRRPKPWQAPYNDGEDTPLLLRYANRLRANDNMSLREQKAERGRFIKKDKAQEPREWEDDKTLIRNMMIRQEAKIIPQEETMEERMDRMIREKEEGVVYDSDDPDGEFRELFRRKEEGIRKEKERLRQEEEVKRQKAEIQEERREEERRKRQEEARILEKAKRQFREGAKKELERLRVQRQKALQELRERRNRPYVEELKRHSKLIEDAERLAKRQEKAKTQKQKRLLREALRKNKRQADKSLRTLLSKHESWARTSNKLVRERDDHDKY